MTLMAPVVPTGSAAVRRRPIGLRGLSITGGLWADRRRIIREATIPHGARQLEAAGNLANLRAAAAGRGEYSGEADDAGLTFPFLDSDVYKWLEAVGWELGQAPDAALAAEADRAIELVAAAQREDGYLNSYFQLATPGRAFHDLEWGHELYTIGHLVQAAIAWRRGLDDERLLRIAERAVERIRAEMGPDGRELIDGHPEIEMALVELYRVTGDERHLELAGTLLERRGRGLLRPDRFDAAYWQDHASVREAAEPAGHAVRQLYLDCGAVDYAVETGDRELLDAAIRRWEAMVATRTYLTGGLGARQRDEAFGDAFELPPDVAYAETCAAIASVMLSWRLLLATGEQRYADLIERTSLNAVLPALGLDGRHFFYANPLQVRSGEAGESRGPTSTRRRPWFPCACCPPNLMRFLATYPDLVATLGDGGLAIHQFASGAIETDAPFGRVRLDVDTAYPWSGTIDLTVADAPGEAWTLALRVPAWCRAGSVSVGDEEPRPIEAGAGELALTRRWARGDHLRLELDMPPRITAPDPRIDAVRGTVAVERGPLVYAIEQADLPDGATLDSVAVSPSAIPELAGADARLPEITLVEVPARIRAADDAPADWPYRDVAAGPNGGDGRPTRLRAVPYFAWGNRGPGGMRVWIPVDR
jgi:DUF1680 family protein